MSSTSVTLHCRLHEPHELRVFAQEFGTFCVLNIDLRASETVYEINQYDIMLPLSMLQRLTAAAAAFNAAMKGKNDGVIDLLVAAKWAAHLMKHGEDQDSEVVICVEELQTAISKAEELSK